MATVVYVIILAILAHIITVYVSGLSVPNGDGSKYLVERKYAERDIIELAAGEEPDWGIVEGSDSGAVPWQVAIRVDESEFCAGSLIALDKVLTSAQCVQGFHTFALYFGSSYEVGSNDTETPEVQKRETNGGLVHPLYNRETLQNDIAIIVVEPAVEETTWVRPVALPTSQDLSEEAYLGVDAVITGWGTADDGWSMSDYWNATLQSVTVEVISNLECSNSTFGSLIVDTHICTSGVGGVGMCVGDAGGALVYHDPVSGPVQIGIGSFVSAQACDDGMPAGFTRTAAYAEWIRDPYAGESSSTVAAARTSLVAILLVVVGLLWN